jgi:hypothetical protein
MFITKTKQNKMKRTKNNKNKSQCSSWWFVWWTTLKVKKKNIYLSTNINIIEQNGKTLTSTGGTLCNKQQAPRPAPPISCNVRIFIKFFLNSTIILSNIRTECKTHVSSSVSTGWIWPSLSCSLKTSIIKYTF